MGPLSPLKIFTLRMATPCIRSGQPVDLFLVFLLSRLLYITEGKYWNQLEKIRKFRVVLSSGSHETGGTAKKVTASDSAKPGPHTHIIFFSQGSRVSVEMGTKSEIYVCVCVYVCM